jgi:hypothetical protein
LIWCYRNDLAKWSEKQGKEGIEQYWTKKNQVSLDNVDTNILALSGVAKA